MALRWDDNIGDWIDDDSGVVGTPAGTPTPTNPGGDPGTGFYSTPMTPTGPTQPSDPPANPGTGGTASTVGPFTGTFSPPTQTPLAPFPTYHAPPAFAYDDFKAPSIDEAMNDPGYQFRTQQGQQALQGWAAARGTLNDSGTAKALTDYGQNAATQEYQNVWNRDLGAYQTNRAGALSTYNTNYQTQYSDPYAFAMHGWEDTTAATQHSNDMNYANAWNQFLNDEDMWKYNTTNALAA